MLDTQQFWKNKNIEELNSQEWESLCDGCALCCLHKIEDEDTREVFYTNVACHLLDLQTCCCQDYENRSWLVPTCLRLNPELVNSLSWLPSTCAYRRIAGGEDLCEWHYLISGDRDAVHRLGISARGKMISENEIDMKDLEDYIVDYNP